MAFWCTFGLVVKTILEVGLLHIKCKVIKSRTKLCSYRPLWWVPLMDGEGLEINIFRRRLCCLSS